MQSLIYIIPLVALSILVAIIALNIAFSKASKRKVSRLVDEITNDSPFRRNNTRHFRPHNDPLARIKLQEELRKKELESSVTVYDPEGKLQASSEEVRIVGLVEPKGFWSKFIMSQKLSYIMARLHFQNNSKDAGFWTNLIKAQAASKGKGQGRGR